MLAAGCGSIGGGFVLAADISASGNFIAVGSILAPCPAFLAAAQELQSAQADPETRQILTYALASNAAGSCILASAEIEKALAACALENLVFDWLIGIPGVRGFASSLSCRADRAGWGCSGGPRHRVEAGGKAGTPRMRGRNAWIALTAEVLRSSQIQEAAFIEIPMQNAA